MKWTYPVMFVSLLVVIKCVSLQGMHSFSFSVKIAWRVNPNPNSNPTPNPNPWFDMKAGAEIVGMKVHFKRAKWPVSLNSTSYK